MDISELAAALNAPDNAATQLGLSRIVSASGLAATDLVPVLYDPANRDVLDTIRRGTNADDIAKAWMAGHPQSNIPLTADVQAGTAGSLPPGAVTAPGMALPPKSELESSDGVVTPKDWEALPAQLLDTPIASLTLRQLLENADALDKVL